jgi:DNA polymerase I-like protein with 3'-5' exonuclease and polymerase domains
VQRELRRATRIVAHNAKFDMHMLANCGLEVYPDKWECTAVREACINEHYGAYDLGSCGERYGVAKDKMSDSVWGVEYAIHVPPAILDRYLKQDVLTLRAVYYGQARAKRKIFRLEKDVLPVLYRMERGGIRVDAQLARDRMADLRSEYSRILIPLMREYPRLNPDSGDSVARALRLTHRAGQWYAGDLAVPSTPTGKPSVTREVLAELAAAGHPLAKQITYLRSIHKLSETFLKGHVLGRLFEKDGQSYIRPHINQVVSDDAGTKTGRLSFSAPALQQIPSKRSGVAGKIRDAFLADVGDVWAYGDYEQNEFRVFAHFSGSEKLYKAYADNVRTDFHTWVAELLNIPRSPPPGGGANAKQVNLGLLFAMGKAKLARELGLPTVWVESNFRRFETCGPETQALLDRYYAEIEGVQEAIAGYRDQAEKRGFVETPAGRRLHFPDRNKSYKAAGLVYQATAADINKESLIKCEQFTQAYSGRVVLNVHDEFSLSIPPYVAPRLPELQDALGNAGLKVPLLVEFTTGPNWYDAARSG